MKKTMIILGLTILSGGQLYAQTDSSRKMDNNSSASGSTKYFYYPESNVYFNEANSNYSYYDPATSTWATNPQLPSTYTIDKNTPKSELSYKGTGNIWTDNATHQKQYGNNNNKKPAPKP